MSQRTDSLNQESNFKDERKVDIPDYKDDGNGQTPLWWHSSSSVADYTDLIP